MNCRKLRQNLRGAQEHLLALTKKVHLQSKRIMVPPGLRAPMKRANGGEEEASPASQ